MIDQLVARYVKNSLTPLAKQGYITRLAGLTKVLETTAFTKGKVNRFPIPVEASPDACTGVGRTFPDLVPDDKENLIVYLEPGRISSNGAKWTINLRLVGWGNGDRFQLGNKHSDAIGTVLVAKILNALRSVKTEAGSPVGSLHCQVTGMPESGPGLFAKYTYTETRSQYLLPPYFSFGLDLQLTCTLNDYCTAELTIVSGTSC